MADPLVIFDNNSNLISVHGVENELTGQLLNTATVQVTLKDANKTDLKRASGTWPESLSNYEAGAYRVVLASTISYPAGESGYAVIAITGSGYTAELWVDVKYTVRKRGRSQ